MPEKKATEKPKKAATRKPAAAKKPAAPKKAVAGGSIAVVEAGGKQYLVRAGESIRIETTRGKKTGDQVEFKVLMTDDGSKAEIGAPFLDKKTITATIESEGKGKKVTVIRYKAKSRYFKKRGHRQPFSVVTVGNF